jgi:Tol biopolymer transport system component
VLGKGLELVVADADGSNPKPITPAVDGLDQFDWSPDGSRIVYLSRTLGRGQINVVDADGTDPSTIKLPFPANGVSWLPPGGTEILFRGEHLLDKDPPVGIFAIHPDGSGLRSLTLRPPLDDGDYQDISASPSGKLVMYRESGLKGYFQIHVLDLGTGADRVLPASPAGAAQTGPGFSPDGIHVVYLRVSAGLIFRLVVAPLDGSSSGTELALRGTLGDDGPTINNYGFTPDGSAVVANDLTSKSEWLLPIDGSAATLLARGNNAYDALSTIQRLAP